MINVIKPQLQKGTLSRLRKNTGINFSNLTANPSDEVTELKKKVIEFAERNTIDVPEKKKYSKGARFRTTSLLCLYNSFQAEHPDDCSYQTFAKYWPVKYVKPCPSEFGTCLCTLCQNMELKVTALQTRKLISHTNYLEVIIIDNRKDDYTRENQFKKEIDALADDDKKNIDVAYY